MSEMQDRLLAYETAEYDYLGDIYRNKKASVILFELNIDNGCYILIHYFFREGLNLSAEANSAIS